MAEDLLTRWGRALDPDRVLPEYPRPQLVRGSWLNLNGRWEVAFRPLDADPLQEYDGSIVVPFAPETPLSGVGRQLGRDEHLWYRRRFDVPDGPADGRVLLHFGAVDQSCVVWVNGTEVGRNEGGYLPFSCDVTDAVTTSGNELVVRVRDLGDNRGPSSGKQRLVRGGIWYTAQSGIWQTVWLERVPAVWVDRLDVVPLLDEGAFRVTVHAGVSTLRQAQDGASSTNREVSTLRQAQDGASSTSRVVSTSSTDRGRVRVLADGREVGAAEVVPGRPTDIPLAEIRPWSPDDPFLYDLEVSLGEDLVTSYAGLRSVTVEPDTDGHPRLLLNGEPYPHVGVLDQGWWSDGGMTAPSEEAMLHDIETMKRLGFTLLRKHVKVEPLRWYHHCDRLGMLVWQDLPNGGERYRTVAVHWPGRRWWPRVRVRDDVDGVRRLLGRGDPAGREVFRAELRRTVEHLRNVTALIVWVPFNEGWGQFDAAAAAAELRALDPTRLVDHASGWHDQGAGDLWSLHRYQRRFRAPRRRRGDRRALVLSEYGGNDLHVDGHTTEGHDFGYGHVDTAAELAEAFTRLHAELADEVPRGLAGTVYTQLADVEDEVNGLLTFDREVLKLDEVVVRAALEPLRAALARPLRQSRGAGGG